jgi:GcrA cell cycle regulator
VALHAELQPSAEEASIQDGNRCSLLDLSKEKCRWPISNEGAVNFSFCGNKPVEGLPYCAGHARIAYRLATRY